VRMCRYMGIIIWHNSVELLMDGKEKIICNLLKIETLFSTQGVILCCYK
jgi:hypothetical protein